ncbi:NAD-dependent DNA ligase LigA [Ichthyobacterium seriolicida]|uniref:DNA ligase n=1 Tax=Ichthyobacterium seriolicida TaxID=242600 RepID=A0A1J1E145_9FLAO|nr:NAD-dependent DNA ligase LigA [Ichthyobacterium seriolicida]BAV94661.1 DNA ligase [Ichthyobacterium seriolicida]
MGIHSWKQSSLPLPHKRKASKYMNITSVEKRIRELSSKLLEHNHYYYDLDSPVISDYEFDKLLEELQELEKEYPQFQDVNSPTKRIGGSVNKKFKTVVHQRKMYSLSNTYSKEELEQFDIRVKKVIENDLEYVCELKYDGVAVSILYRGGKLYKAITRGDGVQGDDITDNVKTINSIPLELKGDFPEDLEVRGEILMSKDGFKKLNEHRINNDLEPFINARNAASGTLKLHDSKEVAKRPLICFVYHVLGEGLTFDKHYIGLQKIVEWGFELPDTSKLANNIDEVYDFVKYWDQKRKDLNFNTDGIVIKVNDYNHQEELGFTAKSPRWAISYKFQSEQAITLLKSIDYQVGRTGAITPVANLEPVILADTIVKRASIYNADFISKMDIRQGDTVCIEKGGEIIPKIVSVDTSKRHVDSTPTIFIKSCPQCDSLLVRGENESQHYCVNSDYCPPQIKGKIEHFISRKAMNIDGLGSETIDLFFEKNIIRDIADLYALKEEDIINLERIAQKSAQNIINGISKSKEVPFHRVLYALGIRHVGETLAKKIAIQYGDIDTLSKTTFEDLIEVDDVGDKIAISILNYFSDLKNCALINSLKEYGIQMKSELNPIELDTNVLGGKSFVISGVFEKLQRTEIKNMIEQNGGKNTSAISKNTSFIIGGKNMGTAKLQKANELNIPIISEYDFLEMLS